MDSPFSDAFDAWREQDQTLEPSGPYSPSELFEQSILEEIGRLEEDESGGDAEDVTGMCVIRM